MKTRLIGALVGLAISFALPIFAQEQTTVDPEVRQQLEAVITQFVEALNKHDAAAAAALYTEDAIRMIDRGGTTVQVGREAIEKDFAENFGASASMPPLVLKTVALYSLEDRLVTISEWSVGNLGGGHSVMICVRDADTWRVRMDFITTSHLVR
jgi:uncharacterized protein (TIGR02246 family)